MSWLGDTLKGAAGSIIGGFLGFGGARETNQANAKTAALQMEFESGQAQLNRDFQERLSGTAHQREVADLRAAGLNPILSGTGGAGASTPSGSKGSSAGFAAVDEIGTAVSSALAARRNVAEVKNMEKMNENIDMDTKLKLEQKRAAHESIYRTKWESDLTEEQFGSERERRAMLQDQRPGSRTEGNIDRSMYGQGLRYADRIGKTIGSALGARRLFRQE